jgi:hypothetical protein
MPFEPEGVALVTAGPASRGVTETGLDATPAPALFTARNLTL